MKFRVDLLLTACLLLPLAALADSPVVFNEIMYHPLTNESQLEWVELQNQMAVDMDISHWRLDGGISFTFPDGTVIGAGEYLVIAASPSALSMATGFRNALGPFSGRLSNAGEQLRLRNNNDRVMDEVVYGVEGDWPVGPDGAGPSLARRRADVGGSDSGSWLASAQVGGTPGAENFPVKPATIVSHPVTGIQSEWSFDDTGRDLGTAWRSSNYDDSTWKKGLSLFFQEEAPLPAAKNTPLAPGRVSYYFRTSFVLTGDVSRVQLQLRPIVDDGAIGYLNGVEVFRVNMPSGGVTYSTLANVPVDDATFGETIYLASDQLLPGRNVLAVEVHQGPSFSAYAQAILDSGPVGYWRLSDPANTAVDAASEAGGQAGAQNGAYAGLAPANRSQAGPRPTDLIGPQPLYGFEANNGAVRFAGNGDNGNDVVTIPDPGVFNFSSTRIFTLEAWANGGAGQENGGPIIAKGQGGGGEQFVIDVVGGNYRFFTRSGGVANEAATASASVGPDGTWQHIVAVLDQPAGRMKIYVNGMERGSQTPSTTLLDTAHEISIGARKNAASANYDLNFEGRIDEVAIYNRALSTNEIAAHFTAAFANNAAAAPDTNDVVFGLEVIAAETLPEPEPPTIAFNELASSTNAVFWLELINHGRTDVDLGGWIIARQGGATNREYTLPARVLAPGQLLTVTRTELGFGADSGDRLVLYRAGRSNVADAVVAKKEPRGRSPDGIGAWWFPNQPTPGASNSFVFRDELVINEIMFHAPELPATPGTFSPTNVILAISNPWKYHTEGVDLRSEWRASVYDDNAWPVGNAAFFAPAALALPAPRNTLLPLTNSSGARIITFYFRTQFSFAGDTNALVLALHPIVDDGAVFYLNGVEVYRLNMPATNISYSTLASGNVAAPDFTGPVFIPANSLLQGLNTLAVEVHKVFPTSPDFCFATELLAFQQLAPPLPFRDSPQSWVELFNRSSHPVDLTGWRLDEGIDYRFAPGTILAPGAYLVVAKDVGALQALYPGLQVVGPFTNRLSRSSDYFVLKDPHNNLADEVRYHEGGHWPPYIDGGGSSLELRDPWSDNTQAEAWAASDETAKSQWQTFTWRGICAPGQTGEPSLWRELAFCLLDGAGEALIDDVSVIETPATAPKQLIANGGFEGGSQARWRFLGTHRNTRVEPEPGNPGNYVLHLVATGPGEYQWDQLETTLTDNLVDGREYEISFRAKWLAGQRKLNARLYFNRLARTFDLDVPVRLGTPGARNSRFVSNLGPTFSSLAHAPVVPNPNEPVTVSVTGDDPQGIASMLLKYSVAGGEWQSTPMTLLRSHPGGFDFVGRIPGQPANRIVQFYVEGLDALGAASLYPARGTNSRALYVVQDHQAAAAPQHNFRIVMTTADALFLHRGTNALSNELLGGTVIYNEKEVFYDVGVRLKGSFVGRNTARVGYHVVFNPEQPFRGVHPVVSVDRAQQGLIGGIAEVLAKQIANHAGGIPTSYDDLARCVAPLPFYTVMSQLRCSAFDADYLDAQFQDGSQGPMFEIEVLRWLLATVDGAPESLKQVGNESGGTAYHNQEVQNYGENKESYRWMFLQANRRTVDDYAPVLNLARTFSMSGGAAFDAQAGQVLDVDEWLRVMAYQQLVNTADVYYTSTNVHNFRLYARPVDGKVLYLPWDWDSVFLRLPAESIFGTGNIAKLIGNPNNRRSYLNHMFDILDRSFNLAYITPWATHYGAIAAQDMSGILSHINVRVRTALSQLPTNAPFAIAGSTATNFVTSNSTVTIFGTAPIQLKAIEVNGVLYPLGWTSTTNWTLTVPLTEGANSLALSGIDNYGRLLTNAAGNISVTNTGPSALQPVMINEWMADNAGPLGFADPADGLFQDWFELFNPNTNAFNLSGYYLTDNLSQPAKWRVPSNTLIAARGFLLVWADNQPNQNTGLPDSDLHAGFQLNAGGEAIGLFAPNGVTPLSTVVFGEQVQNVSQGLFPDGNTNAVFLMTNFTPRAANTLSGPLRIVEVSFNGATMALTWSTTPGRAYDVEYKDELSAPGWRRLNDTIEAGGNTASATDASPPAGHRFYRIRRVD
ncbi:MAG TPA: lamin tail domain-containing protein [Verrucomicrobiae bacterium]|nr:lamin tail domain-containing protein [Verrucomicrobiae bacterium]